MKQIFLHRKSNAVLVVQNILAACFFVGLFVSKIPASKANSEDQKQNLKIAVLSFDDNDPDDFRNDKDLKFIPPQTFFTIPKCIIFTCFSILSNKKNNKNRKQLKYYTLYCCQKIPDILHF